MTLVILLLSSQLAIIRSKYNNNEKEYWILRKALPVNFLKPLIGVCTPWYWILEINIRDRSQKVWKNVNKCWPRIRAELELRVESISWSHEPKVSKTAIFHELVFPKYGNFKIISTDDMCPFYISIVKWDRLYERAKFRELRRKILKLKIIKMFLTNQ